MYGDIVIESIVVRRCASAIQDFIIQIFSFTKQRGNFVKGTDNIHLYESVHKAKKNPVRWDMHTCTTDRIYCVEKIVLMKMNEVMKEWKSHLVIFLADASGI